MACTQCELNDCDCEAVDGDDTGCPHCDDPDPDHCWDCGALNCTSHTEETS